ncbi:sensor histidine kinase [Halobaculum sp. MBLA0147]|uniref:sensor histidine kinase n=1 Tax=Halobaculum sp. MBLA0147 TaxID=3079934 RepID=UPI0035254EEE
MTEVDFTTLHERAATLDAADTTRDVRERTVRLVADVLEYDAVGVYQPEGSRLVARVATDAFESLDPPTTLDPRESPLGEAIAAGEPTAGPAPPSFGDAASWCVAATGHGGGLVVLSETPGAFDADVSAAVAGVSLYVESALSDAVAVSASFRDDDIADEEAVSDRALLDALRYAFTDYAFLFDAEGRYLDVLLGERNLSVYSREDLVGNTVDEVFDAETADRLRAGIDAALSEWSTQTVEYPIDTPDGRLYYEGQISPLPQDDLPTDAAVMVARDVTERIERERRLERQNERLSEFAGVVSHDLRNPMEAANGFLEVARSRTDDEALAKVDSSLDRMEAIVEDLLRLAREGEAVDDVQPVALGEVVRTVWNGLDTGSATLRADGLPTVVADPDGLRRVVANLFRNAIEHGGRTVTVTVTWIGTDPDSADPVAVGGASPVTDGTHSSSDDVPLGSDESGVGGFAIADDGPGIPASERDSVFETGYTTDAEGTGFGLSIVRRIAEAHGWTVRVTDGPEGGARFVFDGVERVSGGGEAATR